MRTEVRCCVCGKHLRWIETPSGGVSHDYCEKHYKEAMENAERYFQQVENEQGREGHGLDAAATS